MTKRKLRLSGCALALASLGSCGPSASSSTHWLRCVTDTDCSDVVVGARCESGYCVDPSGERIAEPPVAGGGDPGGQATAGAASPSSGAGAPSALSPTTTGGDGGASGGPTSVVASGASSGSTSAAASAGSGGVPAGGAASVNATAGAPGTAACAAFDRPFIDSLKSCTADADCASVTYQVDCCGTWAWVGIRQDQVPAFEACESAR